LWGDLMPNNTLYQRSDKRWCYKYTAVKGDTPIQLVQRKNETKTAFKLRCSASEDSSVDMSKLTLGELYRLWLGYQSAHCGKADLSRFNHAWLLFVEKPFAHRKITEIKRSEISDLLIQAYEKGYAAETIKKVRACFTRLYSYAISEHQLEIYNPADKIRIPKNAMRPNVADDDQEDASELEIRFIPTIDLERFLAASKDCWWKFAFLLLLLTGMRPSEMLGLKWSDIKNGSINVRRAITAEGLGSLKSPAAYRKIPLTYATIDILWNQYKLLFSEGILPKSKFIFQLKEGGAPTMQAMVNGFVRSRTQTTVWKKIGRKYHGELIQDKVTFSLYDFRHTFATIHSTVMSPKQLQYIMGHKDIQTTLQYYAGLTNEQRLEAATIMDDMIYTTATAI